MSKRTKLTIAIYIILAFVMSFYLSNIQESEEQKALKAKGVRVVYDDEQKFIKEIQNDGVIYAFGEISSILKKNDIDLSELKFNGENRKNWETKALKNIPEAVMAAKFTSFQALYEREKRYIENASRREKLKKEYEYVEILSPMIHDVKIYMAPEFKFLGQNFLTHDALFESLTFEYANHEEKPRSSEYVIESEYIASPVKAWLILEVKNGKVKNESLQLYSENAEFGSAAKELAGEYDMIGILLKSFALMSLLCIATLYLQRRFL